MFSSVTSQPAQSDAEAHARRAARFGTAYIPPASAAELETLEELLRRRKRAARFGITVEKERKDEGGVNDGNLEKSGGWEEIALEMRRDVERGETLRGEAVHVYGVDSLSTGEVIDYFEGFDVAVEWLNDSSCNVRFKNEEIRERAVKVICGGWEDDGVEDDRKEEEGDGPVKLVVMQDRPGTGADEGVWEKPREAGWRLGRAGNQGIRLWIRAATDKDVRPEKPNPKSKWSRTVRRGRLSGGIMKTTGTRRRGSAALQRHLERLATK